MSYLELMDADMATAQWEVRDGKDEPGDASRAALYWVFLVDHNKEMRLDSNQARKPLDRFKGRLISPGCCPVSRTLT